MVKNVLMQRPIATRTVRSRPKKLFVLTSKAPRAGKTSQVERTIGALKDR